MTAHTKLSWLRYAAHTDDEDDIIAALDEAEVLLAATREDDSNDAGELEDIIDALKGRLDELEDARGWGDWREAQHDYYRALI